jgi:hypothetical protein
LKLALGISAVKRSEGRLHHVFWGFPAAKTAIHLSFDQFASMLGKYLEFHAKTSWNPAYSDEHTLPRECLSQNHHFWERYYEAVVFDESGVGPSLWSGRKGRHLSMGV